MTYDAKRLSLVPTVFHAAPVLRCRCPAKAFVNAQDALHYAQRSADGFGVGYAVWRVQGGRIRLVKRLRTKRIRLSA